MFKDIHCYVCLSLRSCFYLYRSLLKTFTEVHYWERLVFELPNYVIDLCAKTEELRLLRECVMLVVRDYNRSGISPAF